MILSALSDRVICGLRDFFQKYFGGPDSGVHPTQLYLQMGPPELQRNRRVGCITHSQYATVQLEHLICILLDFCSESFSMGTSLCSRYSKTTILVLKLDKVATSGHSPSPTSWEQGDLYGDQGQSRPTKST